MSNWKHAYGWSGHILTPNDENDSDLEDNLVAIDPDKFKALLTDFENAKLDSRIECKVIGIEDCYTVVFLATGTCFSEGFAHYGTVFNEAEVRSQPGPITVNPDADYISAMKEIYGIELPPCKLMVGCASEH